MILMNKLEKMLKSSVFFLVFLLIIITLFFIFFNDFPREDPSILQVHFIDVDQGDSILIQTPNNQNILIDSGEQKHGSFVKRYLKNQGVKHLHMVIGTHPHADHIGGLPLILESFPTDMIIIPPVSHTTQTFEELLNTIEKENIPIQPIPSSKPYVFEDNLTLEFLSPHRDFKDHLNNWSIVLKLTYRDHKFLFTGDIEYGAETALLQDYCTQTLNSHVLKVAHHGSNTSSAYAFLEAVNPVISVISVGKENPYGHPHKETIERLEYFSPFLYRTDLQGTLVLKSDGIKLWSPKPPLEENFSDF